MGDTVTSYLTTTKTPGVNNLVMVVTGNELINKRCTQWSPISRRSPSSGKSLALVFFVLFLVHMENKAMSFQE